MDRQEPRIVDWRPCGRKRRVVGPGRDVLIIAGSKWLIIERTVEEADIQQLMVHVIKKRNVQVKYFPVYNSYSMYTVCCINVHNISIRVTCNMSRTVANTII